MGHVRALLRRQSDASGRLQPAGGGAVGNIYAIPAIAALWTGIERTHATFGFAWLALGNAGIDMALPLRLAPFTGVYGLSFVFALTAATVALMILRRGRRQLYWLAILPASLLLPDLPAARPALRRAAGSTEYARERTVDAKRTLDANSGSTGSIHRSSPRSASGARLIIWPEVPGPIYYYDDPSSATKRPRWLALRRPISCSEQWAKRRKARRSTPRCCCGPTATWWIVTTRSTWCRSASTCHRFFSFVNRITQEAGDFAPGNRIVVFPVDDHRLGMFICYESAFPHEVRQFAKDGAQSAGQYLERRLLRP